MRPRAEVARFVEQYFDGFASTERRSSRDKGDRHHYGLQDVRELLDFIYGGPPASEPEQVRTKGYKA